MHLYRTWIQLQFFFWTLKYPWTLPKQQQQEKGEIVLSLPLKSGLAEGHDRSAGLTHPLGDG